MSTLADALSPKRLSPDPQKTGSPESPPAAGSGDEVSADSGARLVALVIFALGVALAWWIPETKTPFRPVDGFVLSTGLYIGAQAIERFLELLPPGTGSKQTKANRAVLISALAFVLAVLLCENLGLYLLQAVGATDVSGNLDVVITALAIGGGSKPLHDLIKSIEKVKETPPATH